jgi:hypothetical protein
VLLYRADVGLPAVEVVLDRETVWLTQAQMGKLFGRERSVLTKDIRNIFVERELDAKSVSAKFAHTGPDAKFTRSIRGYTINRQRLETNARELEAALQLIRKTANRDALSADEGRGLVDIIARYTQTYA